MCRELHDSTSQLLVALQLQMILLKDAAGDAAHRAEATAEIEYTIAHLQHEIKTVGLAHRSMPFQNGALPQAIASMASDFASLTGLSISVSVEGNYTKTADSAEGSLYRICQEALANIQRHARADTVRICLRSKPGLLRLTIEDNGIGMPSVGQGIPRPCGLGLNSIRQRVEELGGCCFISCLKPGTVLSVTLPA